MIVKIEFNPPLLYDRLQDLSAEYYLPIDTLVSLAVKRLLDDVETVRGLREGKAVLD